MDSHQYFGVPEQNLVLAEQHDPFYRRYRLNTHVPSRKEVATLPPDQLRSVLVDWMNRSVTEIIPSRTQIHEVLMVLRARADAGGLRDLCDMCSNYISGE